MIVKKAADSNVAGENIVSNIIECLLPGLILIHMEGIADLGDEDPLSTSFDGIDRGIKVFNLCFSEEFFATDFI